MRTLLIAVVVAALAAIVAMPADASADRRCGGLKPSIHGTKGPDVLTGTEHLDVIAGGAGNDRIEAVGVDDILCGGAGDDQIDGGEGNDTLRGGAGDDVLIGGDGADYIKGQGGQDHADGGLGADGCLVEEYTHCEADLQPILQIYPFLYGGESQVQNLNAGLAVFGPGETTSSYLNLSLPPEIEFVSDSSDPRCREISPRMISCGEVALGPRTGTDAGFAIGVRIPDCPPASLDSSVSISATASDPYAEEAHPENNTVTRTFRLGRAPSCP